MVMMRKIIDRMLMMMGMTHDDYIYNKVDGYDNDDENLDKYYHDSDGDDDDDDNMDDDDDYEVEDSIDINTS